MQSLRDKLLKAGLVSEDAAKKAEQEKLAPPRSERPAAPRPAPARHYEERSESRLPKLPPLPGTKEASRLAAKKQLETDKKIREKVIAAEILPEPGDTTFYFVTRKNKLRRLVLSAAQAKALEEGKLAVVERPDPDKIEHSLVPPEVAVEVLALSEKAVRFLNREGQKVGFLTDEEIHARASEADVPESEETAAPVATAPASAPAEPAPATGEKWITIRRTK